MADAYVQDIAEGTGKKIQTYELSIGGNTVQAQAVTLVDSSGTPLFNALGTDSYIAISSTLTGKNIQAYENTVNGVVVEAQAIVLT